MTTGSPRLFEAIGIELEYMIVDRETLSIRPIADRVIEAEHGSIVSEIDTGAVSWSNELVLHVIELKTSGPARHRRGLAADFQRSVERIGGHLAPLGAALMPSAMHPWMDPHTETSLWPHEFNPIYETLDRVFGCQGHGWSNLQSTHLNFPFQGDEEFGRLHAAIRFVLPILPALAASSPVVDGRLTDFHDTRLEHYRTNSLRIPSVTGGIIPVPAPDRAAYEERILRPIYDDLEPHDPEGILRYEWANARGAIARFDRMAIEIRILDSQEAPVADMAIATATEALLSALVEGRLGDPAVIEAFPTERLGAILAATIRLGDGAIIEDREYLEALGRKVSRIRAAGLWKELIGELAPGHEAFEEVRGALEVIHARGTLARRILGALEGDTRRERLREVYGEMMRCLAEGRCFAG